MSIQSSHQASRRSFLYTIVALASAAGTVRVDGAQSRREFAVTARRYAYSVAGSDTPEIRVMQNDLVQITFSSEDIPHSFTVEEYRIMRRSEPGKPVTFSFRADRPGRFPFFCNLAADERCRELKGTLIVEASR